MKEKHLKIAKKGKYLIAAILLIAFLACVVYAADYHRVNSGGEEVTINEHGVCKKVTRTAAGDIFVPTKTDAEWTAFRNNAPGVALADCSSACGSTTNVTDIDGNTYNTVSIGIQCWMKENLKVTKNPAGAAISRYCCDGNNCNTDGGLYDWYIAMDGSTTGGAQGICPDDWHVPTDAEWHTLESGLATGSCDPGRLGYSCDPSGTELKIGGSSGFDALLTGIQAPAGTCEMHGQFTDFWSSTASSGTRAWKRNVHGSFSGVARYTTNKGYRFSIRCLMD